MSGPLQGPDVHPSGTRGLPIEQRDERARTRHRRSRHADEVSENHSLAVAQFSILTARDRFTVSHRRTDDPRMITTHAIMITVRIVFR